MFEKILLLSAALLTLEAAYPKKPPLVTIDQGTLQGTYLTSRSGRAFLAFQSIRYAQPPIGKLRFKDPVPPEPWEGIWNAALPGAMCLQYRRTFPPIAHIQESILGDEDCLFLNVYTPQIPTGSSSANFDVIAYIHGGAFMYGSSHEFKPHLLLDKDVVLVTLNYRLGPLGFLTTEDSAVPGNMGLKDQVAALKWIQKNIVAFGGNPNSVTITGNAGGGASVHFHYLSPLSRGLFHRGISQSGSALQSWTLMEKGSSKARQLGSTLGCKTDNSDELAECLRNRPAYQLVQRVKDFQVKTWMYTPFAPFGPTVEVGSSNPFMTKSPINALLDGDAQNLPWITGVTTEEGLYPTAEWVANKRIMELVEEHFNDLASHLLDYNFTVPENKKQDILQLITEHYLHNKSVSNSTKELIQMFGDRLFVVDLVRAAKLQAAVNSAPVYVYRFGYRGKHSNSEPMSGTSMNFGVSHGDDIGYILIYDIMNTDDTEEDKEMSRVMIDIWTSFSHNGDPAPSGSKFTWKPTTRNSKELIYLHIAGPKKLKMKSSENLGDGAFWDSLPIEEPQIGKNTPITFKHNEL
ncbi:venom carboxylesterase-6-like [Periplaneta americana]|uniref:venom carboxylesterase-6-like n=1 Tax=Periplaneta americana TaxID=6978 RepID=UPI0037E81539